MEVLGGLEDLEVLGRRGQGAPLGGTRGGAVVVQGPYEVLITAGTAAVAPQRGPPGCRGHIRRNLHGQVGSPHGLAFQEPLI